MIEGFCPPLELFLDRAQGVIGTREHSQGAANSQELVCQALAENRVFPALFPGLSNTSLQLPPAHEGERPALILILRIPTESADSYTPSIQHPQNLLAQGRQVHWCFEGSTGWLCAGGHCPRILSLPRYFKEFTVTADCSQTCPTSIFAMPTLLANMLQAGDTGEPKQISMLLVLGALGIGGGRREKQGTDLIQCMELEQCSCVESYRERGLGQ